DFCVMSPSVGLWGARYGANTAVKTSAARTMPGNHGSESLGTGTPDPRIEVAVQHVHEEVARQVERAQHEHAGLHDRIVARGDRLDRKSTRLNSSHDQISYAVFCLKKKKIEK